MAHPYLAPDKKRCNSDEYGEGISEITETNSEMDPLMGTSDSRKTEPVGRNYGQKAPRQLS